MLIICNFHLYPLGIKVQQLNKGLPLPSYQTDGAAGVDLYASIEESIEIPSEGRAVIPIGIKVQIPWGYEMQIRPRSGLALNHGITVCNAPGTIDSDFRGEVGVILINHGLKPFVVNKGDRIAQAVFSRVQQVRFCEVDELGETGRGEGGFGHTDNSQ